MLTAFKSYEQCPADQRPAGIPLDAVWMTALIDDSQKPLYLSHGWSVLTNSEYDDYVANMAEKLAEWDLIKDKLAMPNVTPRQLRLALAMIGITSAMIDESLNSLPEPDRSLALIEWEYATHFERTHPLVDSVSTLLGWTSEQLNELWLTASNL